MILKLFGSADVPSAVFGKQQLPTGRRRSHARLIAGRNLAALPVESAQSKTSALPMSNQALHLLTFALYTVLAILFWRAQSA
ncbi:MAG: hypothetical protein WAW35_08270, partial [Sideroxyarcus sp.]